MKINLSSDEHTPLVPFVIESLEQRGHTVAYFGPQDGEEASDTTDWPVVTLQAVQPVADGSVDEAIVMCWTGTGASLAANKVRGIRAALCRDSASAEGARKWNHANVLALSLQATDTTLAQAILDAWFSTPYTTDDWNLKQMRRIHDLEK